MQIKKIIRLYWPLVFVALIFLSAWPLFGRGYIPSHDGEYNIIRFMEFYRMLQSGVLFPKWAPTVNSGYGLPVFIFFYPLPNYVGALFHVIGASFVDSVKLTLAFGYIGALFFCFLWLRKLFSSQVAYISTIIGAFIPYWFVEIYVRGTVPEVIALLFVFLSLYAIESRVVWLIPLSVAGIILSHNILGLIFIPIMFLYAIIQKKYGLFWIFLGIGLASYFWLPALVEQKYVIGLNTVSFKDHFSELYELFIPSWGTELSATGRMGSKVSFQIGIIPIVVIVLSGILLITKKVIQYRKLVCGSLVLLICALCMCLSFTKPFWSAIPLLSNIQYPWRLLVVLIPVIPLLTASILSVYTKKWIWGVFLVFSVILTFSYTRPAVYEMRNDEYYLTRPNFTDGTVSMGNSFSTIWSPWKKERANSKIEITNGKLSHGFEVDTYLRKKFSIESDGDASVGLPISYYPGWSVTVDGVSVPINYTSDGTIRFTVSPGSHKVDVFFTSTPLRMFSSALSICSLFLTIIMWKRLQGRKIV